MELGEKLRQARLEKGLSQKALCGDLITRNMLSQIENGAARPSMKTLQALAARLNQPVGYFLEEAPSVSPNLQTMLSARQFFDAGDFSQVLAALEDYRGPDQIFDREKTLMENRSYLELARQAIQSRREPLAREWLKKLQPGAYWCAALENQRLALLARLGETGSLPSLDEELLLRAEAAWRQGDHARLAQLLEAVEGRTPRWHLLRGRAYFGQSQYRQAVAEYLLAEGAYPKETVPQLELAFRELGDFEKAYLYACKLRSMG